MWLISNGVNAEDSELNIDQRFRYVELEMASLIEAAKPRSPQLLKFHLPYNLLPAAVEAGHGKVKTIIESHLRRCICCHYGAITVVLWLDFH